MSYKQTLTTKIVRVEHQIELRWDLLGQTADTIKDDFKQVPDKAKLIDLAFVDDGEKFVLTFREELPA